MDEHYYSRGFPVRYAPLQGYLVNPIDKQKYKIDEFSKFLDTLYLCIESNLGLKRELMQPINGVISFTDDKVMVWLNFNKAIFDSCGILQVFNLDNFSNPDTGMISLAQDYDGLSIECILHIDIDFFNDYFHKFVHIFNGNKTLVSRTKVIQRLLEVDKVLFKNIGQLRKEIEMSDVGADFMNVNPIFQARNLSVNPDECFYIMHFNDNRESIFNLLSKNIEEKYGIQLIKSGDKTFNFNKTIMESIWVHINTSPFVIADISDRNPNVFYELGICHTIGKTVIPICDEDSIKHDYNDSLPFDIAARPVIIYKNAINKGDELVSRVNSAIDSVLNHNK